MSNEPFLSRWSRLKREAPDKTAPLASPTAENKEGAKTEDLAAGTGEAPPEEVVDLASLPPLESILADTDIRGFLQRGVPAELTQAALRRAWVADPAIRGFIGLAENQWDFTDPDAMFGFGPLRPTDNVAELVSQATGNFKTVVLPEVATGEGVDNCVISEANQPAEAAEKKADARVVSEPGKSGFEGEPSKSVAVQEDAGGAERRSFPMRRSGGGALPE
jgi:hypothetical protein